MHLELPNIGPAESVVVDGLITELRDLNERLKEVKATAEAEGERYRESEISYKSGTALDRLRQQKTKVKVVEDVSMYNQAKPYELTPMEKFVVKAEKRTMEALARTDEVQELFKSVLVYFGEDPAMSSVDFFGTLNKFVGALDGAYEVVKRLEAQKAAEERKAAAHRAREEKKAKAQKEKEEELSGNGSSATIEKGKLDLSGQRKQFADPFAGPDKQDDATEPEPNALTVEAKSFADPFVEPSTPNNAQDENTPNSILTNSSTLLPTKTQSLKFFPATSPGANESLSKSPSMKFFPATSPVSEGSVDNTSSRTQRYNNKTSLSARTHEGETNPDPRAALMAMLSKRKNSPTQTEGEVGKFKEAASKEMLDDPQPDPRAALSAMLSKRNSVPAEKPATPARIEGKEESTEATVNDKDEQDDVKADPKAALMAMLSKRNSVPSDEPSAPHSEKKLKDEDATQTGDPNQALNENRNNPVDVLPDSLNMPSFDTAPSTEELQKVPVEPSHNKIFVKNGTDVIPSNATPVNIAAMAAATAKKKSASTKSSPPSSIEKRKTKSKFSDAGSSAPMGIAAMAAAAARQKMLLKEAINECNTSDLRIGEASTTSNHLKGLIEASKKTYSDDIDEA